MHECAVKYLIFWIFVCCHQNNANSIIDTVFNIGLLEFSNIKKIFSILSIFFCMQTKWVIDNSARFFSWRSSNPLLCLKSTPKHRWLRLKKKLTFGLCFNFSIGNIPKSKNLEAFNWAWDLGPSGSHFLTKGLFVFDQLSNHFEWEA